MSRRAKKRKNLLIIALSFTAVLLICIGVGIYGEKSPSVPESALSSEYTTEQIITQTTAAVTETKPQSTTVKLTNPTAGKSKLNLGSIPKFKNSPYVEVNGNVPQFSASEKKHRTAYESYSPLDSLGRCGTAFACLCRETMPAEERGAIGSVRPSGWHTVRYDCVDGKYLYNRCHLIGYQLSAENANERNLITGTRYLNVEGMLPFENMVADYIRETSNHVLYKVTPVYSGKNLVASGVQMQAWSVEDKGSGISFNVYCYNSQPGVKINYSNGESALIGGAQGTTAKKSTYKKKPDVKSKVTKVVKPKNSRTVYRTPSGKRYHYSSTCGGKNSYEVSLDEAKKSGLTPCMKCGK